jgi:hypothetical protein
LEQVLRVSSEASMSASGVDETDSHSESQSVHGSIQDDRLRGRLRRHQDRHDDTGSPIALE